MDVAAVRDLVLNVNHPVVLSGLNIDWICIKEPFTEWLHRVHEDNQSPVFHEAPQTHGNSPQFERFRTSDKFTNFSNFLDYSKSGKHLEKWTSFSYQYLRDLPSANSAEKPINMSFCGFPEISEEIAIWLGTAGAHTSCHYDTYGRNVVVQAYGQKRWIMFHPDTPNMRSTRIPFEESSVYSAIPFFSPKDPAEQRHLADYAYILDLNPGDVLVVPPKWWHYVEALDNSLSFNAWIPIEDDRITRLDEYLVLYQLSNIIPKDLPEETRKLLLNPNSDVDDLPCPTDLLGVLIKDATENSDHPARKKTRREYQNNYLSLDQVDDLLKESSKWATRITQNPTQFMKIMTDNSSRFCQHTEDTITSTLVDPQLTILTSLINSLCAPSTIETARNILLKSHLKD